MKNKFGFGELCQIVGLVVLIALVLFIPYKIGFNKGQDNSIESIGIQVIEKDCEYSRDGLSFKGYCEDVHDLIDLQQRREEFDNYKQQKEIEFNTNCKRVMKKNIWKFIINHPEGFGGDGINSLEELEQLEDFQMVLDMGCGEINDNN